MTEAALNARATLIAAAILNKYQGVAWKVIYEVLEATEGDLTKSSEPEIRNRLRPIESPTDDIHNQVVLLTLIERFWSTQPKLDHPLTTLNQCSFGLPKEPVFRSVDIVEDFGGIVPTRKEEIRERLDELERLCWHSTNCMTQSSIEDKALILAYIMGALVRIHPFADGNGRTARLFVFYALRCWGLPLFPIPKVRNDSVWKLAMNKAVEGDATELKKQLLSRMSISTSSAWAKPTQPQNEGF